MFSGIYQILHTPFDETGEIDWESYASQIDYCLNVGVHGLVVPAMASEFFTLSDKERFESAEFALKEIAGRVPVIIGVQGVSLPVALTFARHAAEHGADGVMSMPPYLRKAPPPDIEAYFCGLAGVGLPVMIQNAPAPVGSPLAPAALVKLMDQEANISYVKEETSPILQKIGQICELAGSGCLGVFGGANGLYLIEELERGACGNMPAGGAVDIQVKIYNLYMAGEWEKAQELNFRLLPLLSHSAVYGVTFHKFLLWRRGVLKSRFARDPQQLRLDAEDERTLIARWERVADEAHKDYPLQ